MLHSLHKVQCLYQPLVTSGWVLFYGCDMLVCPSVCRSGVRPSPKIVWFTSGKYQNVPRWSLSHPVHFEDWTIKVKDAKMPKSFLP